MPETPLPSTPTSAPSTAPSTMSTSAPAAAPAAAPASAPINRHRWQFFRSGGFDQVALRSADDLRHLGTLDPKLWTVLACPTEGLELDARTLNLIDSNRDGRVSIQEVVESVRWACHRLRDPQVLLQEGPLDPAGIETGHPEGRRLAAAAVHLANRLGREPTQALSVHDFRDAGAVFPADRFNGDGVVTAALAASQGLDGLVEAIIETQGSVPDRSGAPGVDAARLKAFCEQAATALAWHQRHPGPTLLQALAAVQAVAAKVEDHYTRCRLAAFDPQARAGLGPTPKVYESLQAGLVSAQDAAIEALPLAALDPEGRLPLRHGVNPAWAQRMEALQRWAVEPFLGAAVQDTLTAAQWQELQQALAPALAWRQAKPGGTVSDLDGDRLQRLMADDAPARLETLLAQDRADDASAPALQDLQRLVHLRRDLGTLLRNFVALSDFYAPGRKAIFQAGTLFIDRRSCDLVLQVQDPAAHARMAPLSHCFLLYCKVERVDQPSRHIVAALTAGSVDDLMVAGRHGVYVDRAGREWLATVTQVIEQPISIRQAFFTPYRRAAAFVEAQIRNFAASKDKESDALAQGAVGSVGAAATQASARQGAISGAAPGGAGAGAGAGASAKPAAPFDIARFAGIFAAIGLAVGAIGTAVSAIVAGLFQLSWWQWPLAIAGGLMVVSGPSMLLAWLKLRRRNVGPLLDANGWAINARAHINLPFGRSLTSQASLPPWTGRTLGDPYAEEKRSWPAWVAAAVLLGLAATAGWWWWLRA